MEKPIPVHRCPEASPCFDKPFNQSIRALFAAPFQLRSQDCEAAFRRGAATNLSATAMTTGAPFSPQASASPQTAASPAPYYFTADTLEAAEVREQASVPTAAFPFSAPVVSYRGLDTRGPAL